MRRRNFTTGGLLLLSAGPCSVWAAAFGDADAAQAVRIALERAAHAAVDQLGRVDGFLGNPQVRIALPGGLNRVAQLLKAIGWQKQIDELVTSMNRAAEAAVPLARTLLVNAAKAIAVDDAIKIVRGGETSVADYFAGKTRAPLAAQFLPIVTQATEKVELASQYNAVAAAAGQFGLLKGDEINVQRYVTAKSLDGLFLMIGVAERKLRRDPIGSGSAILKKGFGG